MDPTTKRCPFCAEEIQAAAVLCRFCRSSLPSQGTFQSELLLPRPAPRDSNVFEAPILRTPRWLATTPTERRAFWVFFVVVLVLRLVPRRGATVSILEAVMDAAITAVVVALLARAWDLARGRFSLATLLMASVGALAAILVLLGAFASRRSIPDSRPGAATNSRMAAPAAGVPAESESSPAPAGGPMELLATAREQLRQGALPEAEQFLREYLRADPKSRDALLELTRALARQGRSGEAYAVAKNLLDDHPSDVTIKVVAARTLANTGAFDDARRYLEAEAHKHPGNPVLLRGIAGLLASEAARLDSKARRRAYQEDQRFDLGAGSAESVRAGKLFLEALPLAEAAVRADPQDASGLTQLGRTADRAADVIFSVDMARWYRESRSLSNTAVTSLKRAIELDPTNGLARVSYAKLLVRFKPSDAAISEAIDHCEVAVRHEPKNQYNWEEYIWILGKVRRFEEGEAVVQRAMHIGGMSPEDAQIGREILSYWRTSPPR